MPGSPQSDDQIFSERTSHAAPNIRSTDSDFSNSADRANTRTNLPSNLEERELEAALQLLVERAQYITGATGTALALPQGDEMVCRASAGACAPTVGARLQVRSGLTGESIARRQLLRCDNAETDPRVNLETCRALGIASIVVLPLLRRTGEVRGLFELFSDHPYAFEERDLVALERMAALTLTALDLAEQQHDSVAPSQTSAKQTKPAGPLSSPTASAKYSPTETSIPQPFVAEPVSVPSPSAQPPEPIPAADAEASTPETAVVVESGLCMPTPVIEPTPQELAPVPEAMRRVQKCASCGFPVSEGRTLCLDCESLERLKIESERRASEKAARELRQIDATASEVKNAEARTTEQERAGRDAAGIDAAGIDPNETKEGDSAESFAAPAPDEILPPFLTNPHLVEESWLARHVNLLAFLVLVAAVLVAAVVFFR